MTSKSFVFHEEWRETLSGLPAQVRLEVYDAIVQYGLSGTLVELKAMAELAFSIIKKRIDNDNHRAESIRKKRSEAGKKHKGNQHTLKNGTNGTSVPTEWNKCSKTSLYKGVSEDLKNGTSVPNENLQQLKESPLIPLDEETTPITPKEVNPPIIPQENPSHKRARVFVKPTVEEINSYCEEKGYKLDAEYFFNFYETNGWVQGKARKPIKNWKACVSTWIRNNKNGTDSRTDNQTQSGEHPSDSELRQQSVRIMERLAAERHARQATLWDGTEFSTEGQP